MSYLVLDDIRWRELWEKIKSVFVRKDAVGDTLVDKDGVIDVKTPIEHLAKEDYNALSEEEKQKDILYVTDDSEPEPVMAAYYKGNPIFGPRGPAGPDGNPVGTVISYMGTTAPTDYLVCDGSSYSISEYPDLAAFFKEQFGDEIYFGSNGDGTFAVPDMRNLFIRGYHGNASERLSGEIGKKQEATSIPYAISDATAFGIKPSKIPVNTDTLSPKGGQSGQTVFYIEDAGPSRAPFHDTYTSRPVNMAVLYCIKAVKSDPLESGGNGFSPTIEVEPIDGGHRIIITDINGEKSFDVLNGKDGSGESSIEVINDGRKDGIYDFVGAFSTDFAPVEVEPNIEVLEGYYAEDATL